MIPTLVLLLILVALVVAILDLVSSKSLTTVAVILLCIALLVTRLI